MLLTSQRIGTQIRWCQERLYYRYQQLHRGRQADLTTLLKYPGDILLARYARPLEKALEARYESGGLLAVNRTKEEIS